MPKSEPVDPSRQHIIHMAKITEASALERMPAATTLIDLLKEVLKLFTESTRLNLEVFMERSTSYN